MALVLTANTRWDIDFTCLSGDCDAIVLWMSYIILASLCLCLHLSYSLLHYIFICVSIAIFRTARRSFFFIFIFLLSVSSLSLSLSVPLTFLFLFLYILHFFKNLHFCLPTQSLRISLVLLVPSVYSSSSYNTSIKPSPLAVTIHLSSCSSFFLTIYLSISSFLYRFSLTHSLSLHPLPLHLNLFLSPSHFR